MKLNENKIDNIVDSISEYIYDNPWNEFSIEWIQDYLSFNIKSKYDNEDLDEILKRLQDVQKEMQEERISEEKETLYQEIDNLIADMDIHLSPTDISKVLAELANDYLNG